MWILFKSFFIDEDCEGGVFFNEIGYYYISWVKISLLIFYYMCMRKLFLFGLVLYGLKMEFYGFFDDCFVIIFCVGIFWCFIMIIIVFWEVI